MCVTITNGELAEWSNAAVLKTVVPQGTRGSNPLLSAIQGLTKTNPPLKLQISLSFPVFYFNDSNHLKSLPSKIGCSIFKREPSSPQSSVEYPVFTNSLLICASLTDVVNCCSEYL